MKNEKIVFFVKREKLFPDTGIFKKLNKLYLWFIINIFILRIIKKYENKDLIIISDYVSKIELEKKGIKSRLYADYSSNFSHEEKFIEAKKLVRKWLNFDKIEKILKHKDMDLSFLVEYRLASTIMLFLEYVDEFNKIITREKPDGIILWGKDDLINKCCKIIAKNKKIKINHHLSFLIYIQEKVQNIGRRILFHTRFHNLPSVTRKDFVKTGNFEKIKKTCEKGKRNILISGIDNIHYERIENVVKELIKSKENNIIMLTVKKDTQNKLKKERLNFVSFGDFIPGIKKEIKDIKKKEQEISKLWKELEKDKEFYNLFLYKNINVWQVMQDELDYIFSLKLRWILYYIECMKKLLDEFNIGVVAGIGDAGGRTRTITMAAKRKNIPTIIVENSMPVSPAGLSFLPLTADKMAVWGKKDKEYMIKYGKVKSDRIIIAGSHIHDSAIKEIDKQKKNKIFEKLKLNKNKRIVLLASAGFMGIFWAEKARIELINLVVNAIKNEKDKQCIIKLHPIEDKSLAKKIIEESGAKNCIITKDEFNISDLIKVSEVIVSLRSTIAYDAILNNKPIINVNLSNIFEQVNFNKYKVCINIYKKEDFFRVIKEVWEKKMQRKLILGKKRFIKDHLYKLDGKSSKRIARIIEKMASN